MRLFDENDSPPPPKPVDPTCALVDRLLAEQDRVISELDELDMRIQRVIAALVTPPPTPSADAA